MVGRRAVHRGRRRVLDESRAESGEQRGRTRRLEPDHEDRRAGQVHRRVPPQAAVRGVRGHVLRIGRREPVRAAGAPARQAARTSTTRRTTRCPSGSDRSSTSRGSAATPSRWCPIRCTSAACRSSRRSSSRSCRTATRCSRSWRRTRSTCGRRCRSRSIRARRRFRASSSTAIRATTSITSTFRTRTRRSTTRAYATRSGWRSTVEEIKAKLHHGIGVIQDDPVSPAHPAFDKSVPTDTVRPRRGRQAARRRGLDDGTERPAHQERPHDDVRVRDVDRHAGCRPDDRAAPGELAEARRQHQRTALSVRR